MSELIECPGIAHELDGRFNPGSQGPYGPGYHYCFICDGDGELTKADLVIAKLEGLF